MIHFAAGLPCCIFLVLRSMYSSKRRTNWMTATMKAPRAMEPRWYQAAFLMARATGRRGISALMPRCQ